VPAAQSGAARFLAETKRPTPRAMRGGSESSSPETAGHAKPTTPWRSRVKRALIALALYGIVPWGPVGALVRSLGLGRA